LRAPNTDPSTVNMELPLNTTRANKYLTFDVSGNPAATNSVGTYRGNWAAGTAYVLQDIVKDTSTSNIFIAITAHTSSGSQPLTTNTDAAKWSLVVDAASAGSSASAAAASATAAASSATAAASSASSATSSASTATTKASAAATSATGAASSATSATSSASTATTKASEASTSATSAASSATSATSSASSATSSASSATSSASTATTKASEASTSASTATTKASAASTSATAAATSATAAATSATASASSATASAASAAAAAATKDSIDEFYLGAQSSNPTVDNNGDAVTAGDWYFNTSANETRIYNGSAWQVTAVSTAGLLTAANNLSDLANAGTARSNLGLGTAATTAATAYVGKTAATGSASIPVGTTVQRDGSPAAGMFRYNSTTDEFEGYADGAWGSIGGGASAGGAIYENSNAVAANYTLTSGTNGMSVGPITIASGVTVTVPSGANWVVL
jgi:hypothetical protein